MTVQPTASRQGRDSDKKVIPKTTAKGLGVGLGLGLGVGLDSGLRSGQGQARAKARNRVGVGVRNRVRMFVSASPYLSIAIIKDAIAGCTSTCPYDASVNL
jgi:hypothetical protein